MKTLKSFGVFILSFLVYHITFSRFFPVDENNVLQAPDWYSIVGIAISVVISVLLIKKPFWVNRHKRLKKEQRELPIEPVIGSNAAHAIPTATKNIESEAQSNKGKSTQDELVSNESFARFGGIDAALLSVDLMSGSDFENYCAGILRRIGYYDVTVTPASGDQGVDIIATKDGVKYAIQCKCYSSDLGNTPVQEVLAGKKFYDCHVGVVLTNRFFTPGAKALATKVGVLLWNRDTLTSMINAAGIQC